jgi:DNA topoisomerase I
MTRVERLQTKGIRRIGTKYEAFKYEYADGKKVNGSDLKRIKALRIPPAWVDVAVNPLPGGMLQAVGKDAAGRWQYLYHENHTNRQEQKKSERLVHFVTALPKMRKAVPRDLARRDLGRERVMACILRILSTCFMRPGSQVYARENGSYGIATLRPRHVKVRGDLVEFDFRGKSRVVQHQELRDRQVAKVVRELLKHPAKEVFKYQDEAGDFVDVKRRHINHYIKEVMGDRFSAKDFRTLAGTLICACALARAAEEISDGKTAVKRKVIAAIRETAEVLGNTPAVCRSSYISPIVLISFEKGNVVDHYFGSVEELVNYRSKTLHRSEKALLKLLKSRAPRRG